MGIYWLCWSRDWHTVLVALSVFRVLVGVRLGYAGLFWTRWLCLCFETPDECLNIRLLTFHELLSGLVVIGQVSRNGDY